MMDGADDDPLADLPHDADGDRIRQLAAEGSDLAEPMSVDFFVAAPSEQVGRAVAEAAEKLGYRSHVDRDGQADAWTCYCAREMVVTYEAVTAAQQQLDAFCRPLGGTVDGWGSFGNA